MGGAALASILQVAGHPSPSHCRRPIVVVQSPSSNFRPRSAAVIFIDSVADGGGGGIIAVAVAIAVAIPITVSAIAIVVVTVIDDLHQRCPIVDIQSPSLNRRRCLHRHLCHRWRRHHQRCRLRPSCHCHRHRHCLRCLCHCHHCRHR
jgi:hypothetical protein